MNENRTCPQCRQSLGHDAPDGLCPECLMLAALGTQSLATAKNPGQESATIAINPGDTNQALPKPNEQFGGYRIIHELGHGGMGAVYEAEHLESGRRVALKVLSRQLDSPEARARFIREGRLAASINHPNSVYVFGTEEIEGTPVIAMELVAGGTLQERVRRQGALEPSVAVDAVLQLVAGLEAAQAIGILHRDIKPANCFEDLDGTVKIGDFGLSISSAARAETNLTLDGAFLGTPAFCSPEQLRGEELSLRSDIYSVGVTLFFLLTGSTPFEGKNMVQLLANVIEQPPPSPRTLQNRVPTGLANVVVRCLAKQAGDRFRSYEELRQALAPYSSDAPVSAPLALRFFAGVIDISVLSTVITVIAVVFFGGFDLYLDPMRLGSHKFLGFMGFVFGLWLLYYAVLEGKWGASIGKALCRLRVVGSDRVPPGILRALLRAVIYVIVPILPYWALIGIDPRSLLNLEHDSLRYLVSVSCYVVIAMLFSTARQRNGLAAIHDLISGTRVIRRPMRAARPLLPSTEPSSPGCESVTRIGPYHVIETIGTAADCEWLLGYDTRLLRKVWIRVTPAGTPPVDPTLRNLGRAGRLRWLSGRRTDGESWDAYEAVTGKPLVQLLNCPQAWGSVRWWLLDLATELAAAERDGTIPTVLSPDRVWITAEGRAKLLDFDVPGLPRPGSGAASSQSREIMADSGPLPPVGPTSFVGTVAKTALAGSLTPPPDISKLRAVLPIHARVFLQQFPRFTTAENLTAALKPIVNRVTTLSRLRRAALVMGCLAVPLLTMIVGTVGLQMVARWHQAQPGVFALAQTLSMRSAQQWVPAKNKVPDRTFAIYIAAHFTDLIRDTNAWNGLYPLSMIQGEKRRFAERAVVEWGNAPPEDVTKADAVLNPILPAGRIPQFTSIPWLPFMIGGFALALYVGVPAVIAALLFRGGLVLFAAGVAVVRNDGLRASRFRVLWRSLLAWSPVIASPIIATYVARSHGGLIAALITTAALATITVLSLLLPDRSLPDRLAGTRLVPR